MFTSRFITCLCTHLKQERHILNGLVTFKSQSRLYSYSPSKRRRLGKLSTMKFDTPEFHSLFTPELRQLVKLFEKYQYDLRIAGGAVRDLLMGISPADIDFATTATPDQMKAMFETEEIRMINTKGEKHGTITARINDKENFEVTTLRIDVETDGRHAKVEFTRDWQLDANRRDLTVNAMFLGFDGTLYDYFNGREDLGNRKICFVGEASERIKEDYLRILRYFRFCGRICAADIVHDDSALDAIQKNMDGLKRISGERIWTELKKIACGGQATSLVQVMMSAGMAPYIGLPDDPNVEEFKLVWSRSAEMSPQPMTLLATLLKHEQQVYDLNQRLKMSTDELKLGLFIVNHRLESYGDDPIRFSQDLLVDTVGKEPKVKDRICELFKYKGEKDLLRTFTEWIPPKFPITGYDLVTAKVPKGPMFAKTLNHLRQIWKESRFTLSKDDLLSMLEDVIEKESR